MTDCSTWLRPALLPYWQASAWTRGCADYIECLRPSRTEAMGALRAAMAALGWERTPHKEAADHGSVIAHCLLGLGSTWADAKEMAAVVEQISPRQRSRLEQLFLDTVTDCESEDEWRKVVVQASWEAAEAEEGN